MSNKKDILEEVVILEKEAREFGFHWSHYEQLIQQVQSECEEIKEVIEEPGKRVELQEELGDLMHVALCFCIFCEFSPEKTLELALSKFRRRFEEVVKLARSDGLLSLEGQPMDVLMNYWRQAKRSQG